MIYVTGDTHSDFSRFRRAAFPEQTEMTKEDFVIIAGDFGGIWYQPEDISHLKNENYNLDELDARNFTTLFVPGNHENYDRLMSEEFPVKEWNGGLIKEIRPSVLMLMRGEMYTLDEVKLFSFGGARSHDIQDGILDINDPGWKSQAKELQRQGKIYYRVKGLSWWEQELPTEEEMLHGWNTLEKHDWKSDLVITHCAPYNIQTLYGIYENDVLTDYLEKIRQRMDYSKWYFGHYHGDRNFTVRDVMCICRSVRTHCTAI